MRVFKVTLAYDGTDFSGWQRQSNARSVQAVLEDVLAPIERGSVAVTGAGRTDSGVHAIGQVASFALTSAIPPHELHQALNATLPGDVRALSVEEAAPGFNARFHARSKVYRYRIVNANLVSPFERRFAWHVSRGMDLESLRLGANELVGEHDFSAFQAAGSSVTTSVRTITRSEWQETPLDGGGRLLSYEVAGTGFLKYMVRTMVGTLVEVGDGRRAPDSLREIVASGQRSQAGPTAPPHGLYLVRVDYDVARPVSFF